MKDLFSFIGNDFGCEPCFQIDSFDTEYEAELYAQLRIYRTAYRNLKDKISSIGQLNSNFKLTTTYLGQEIDTSSDRNKKEEE